MATGTTVVDFGASPGKSMATVVITGQGALLAGSAIEAYLAPAATADHSEDEHRMEDIAVSYGAVVAGVGFTIFAQSRRTGDVMLRGTYTVAWVWV